MKDKEKAEKKLADEENKKRQKAEKEKQKKEAQLKKKEAQLKKQQTPMKKDVSQNSKLNSYFTAKPTANSAEKENKEKEKIAAQVRIDRYYLSRKHQV